MAETLGTALLELDTNDKGLKRHIQAAEKDVNRLGGTFDRIAARKRQGKALWWQSNASAGGGMGGRFRQIATLFRGGHYEGRLLPSGTWGIVGERAPEPVISVPPGAWVIPSSALSDMRGGVTVVSNISINGSGLSQRELPEAITDAFECYDLFHLSARVSEIQRDPMARV
jgi:hypothetical protein